MAKTESVALVGAEGRLVDVEVHVDAGIPAFSIVGLPTKSVREAEQRTRSAIRSSGEDWPKERIVANLAPGGLRKEGSHFDLAIALGVLGSKDRVPQEALAGWVVMGELALDGEVRPVRGTLPAAIACRAAGRRGLICPRPNGPEGRLVEDVDVVGVTHLRECIDFLRGDAVPLPIGAPSPAPADPVEDLLEVRGHQGAKFALEVAAAGGHNLLLSGPPGSGKSMLARRLPGLLPPLQQHEALEVTGVYSVAGLLRETSPLINAPPFRSPHHTISLAGMVGGGSGLPKPGEISFAHRGVLFLDELPLFRADVLETLRAPLEDGVATIVRSGGFVTFPCRFSLIGAMNPCRCGFLGDRRRQCRCSPRDLEIYRNKLSGPLLDRFDMQVEMPRLTKRELLGEPDGECSESVRARVVAARALQAERYGSASVTNASAPKARIERVAALSSDARECLSAAVENGLSGRGLDRTLRVARTMADLRRDEWVTVVDIAQALSYRRVDGYGAAA